MRYRISLKKHPPSKKHLSKTTKKGKLHQSMTVDDVLRTMYGESLDKKWLMRSALYSNTIPHLALMSVSK